MKSLTISSLFATSVLLLAGSLPAASAQEQQYVGCFSSSKPLVDQGSYTYQSNGWCHNTCKDLGSAVFGLYNGNHCFCGDMLPAKDSEVDDKKCDKPCAAWPIVMCGGSSSYSIYLTGLKDARKVDNYGSSSSTSTTTSKDSTTTKTGDSQTSTETGHTGVSTVPAETSFQTPTATGDAKNGPNTAAIAAGVVIGVVGLASLIGAGFFIWRFKTRHPADQRFQDNNMEHFGKPPMSQDSMSNHHFDTAYMNQRRPSNGSIDDDRDFSHRVLQVTNPDRGYHY